MLGTCGCDSLRRTAERLKKSRNNSGCAGAGGAAFAIKFFEPHRQPLPNPANAAWVDRYTERIRMSYTAPKRQSVANLAALIAGFAVVGLVELDVNEDSTATDSLARCAALH